MADAAPIDYDDTPNPIPYGGGPKTTKKKAENRMTSMKAPKSSGGEKFSDGSKAAEVTEGPGRAEPEPDELSSGLEAVRHAARRTRHGQPRHAPRPRRRCRVAASGAVAQSLLVSRSMRAAACSSARAKGGHPPANPPSARCRSAPRRQ